MMKSIKFLACIALILFLCGFSSKQDKLIESRVAARIEIPTWYHEGLYFDGNNIWVANGLKGNVWIVDLSSGKVVKELKTSGTFTEAIASTDEYPYLVSDWDLKKIYSARLENNIMSSDKEFSVEPAHPTGMTWNGKNLFVITWTRSLTGTKFHLLKMDARLNTLLTHKIREIQEPCQITWDGKNLWISSWYEDRIYKIDVDTLDVLGYFKSPVKKTTGIAWDGSSLWVTGTYSDLYRIELQN